MLSKISNFALTLPTSSADIEQAFSVMKLIKTGIRNRLTEGSLESLMLIFQEYQENKGRIRITREMIFQYEAFKTELNERKSRSRQNLRRTYNNMNSESQIIRNLEDEELIVEFEMKKMKKEEVEEKENGLSDEEIGEITYFKGDLEAL